MVVRKAMIAIRRVRFKNVGLPDFYMRTVIEFLRSRNPDPKRHVYSLVERLQNKFKETT